MAHPRARTGWQHDSHLVQREFERVGQFLVDDAKVINAIASALGSTPEDIANQDPKDIALWALTIFIDGKHLEHKKVVQGINFESNETKKMVTHDSPIVWLPIKWFGKNKPLGKEYRTIDEAERSDLEAWASIPFSDMTRIKGPMSVEVISALRDLSIYGLKGEYYSQTVKLVNDVYKPGPNMFYGTDNDIFAKKGWYSLSAITGGARLEIDFDYTDIATGNKLIGTLPQNKKIYKITVMINTAFDNDTKITVGAIGETGSVMIANEIDTSDMNIYQSDRDFGKSVNTDLYVFREGANIPTIGSGTIIIYYL